MINYGYDSKANLLMIMKKVNGETLDSFFKKWPQMVKDDSDDMKYFYLCIVQQMVLGLLSL